MRKIQKASFEIFCRMRSISLGFQVKWKDYVWEIDTGGEDFQLEGWPAQVLGHQLRNGQADTIQM